MVSHPPTNRLGIDVESVNGSVLFRQSVQDEVKAGSVPTRASEVPSIPQEGKEHGAWEGRIPITQDPTVAQI